jgi:hypothetical protein
MLGDHYNFVRIPPYLVRACVDLLIDHVKVLVVTLNLPIAWLVLLVGS